MSRLKAVLTPLLIFTVSAAQAQARSVDGHYARGRPADAQLLIRTKPNGVIHLIMTDLARQNNGSVLFGSCQAVAEGRRHGRVLDAKVIPFHADAQSIDAAGLLETPSSILLRWLPNGSIEVERFGFDCGMTYLDGYYRRARSSALRPGPPDPFPPEFDPEPRPSHPHG